MRIAGITTVIALTTIILPGCNNLEFESRWRDRDISVDGFHIEWEDALMFSEEKRVTLGFMNDDRNLYLCLIAADQHVLMQSLAAGFTVWFDGMGDKKEKFGIKYPVGMKITAPDMPRGDRGRPDQNRIPERLEDQSDLVIIRSEGSEKLNLSEAAEYGISIKIGQYMGRFIYELGIPLQSSDSDEYAILPDDNGTIKVGFELGKMEMPGGDRRPPGERAGFPGSVRPGGDRGKRGPRGENRPERPQDFKIQLKVKLAKNPVSDK